MRTGQDGRRGSRSRSNVSWSRWPAIAKKASPSATSGRPYMERLRFAPQGPEAADPDVRIISEEELKAAIEEGKSRAIREGKHGARSPKQAIAIGLSKARRAGVKLGAPGRGKASAATRRKAKKDLRRGRSRRRPSARRSRAVRGALRREPRSSASRKALAKQAHRAAMRRGRRARSAAAKKAVRTKGPARRRAAARKAARTRKAR